MTQAPSISTLDFTNNYTYAGWANTLDLFEKSFDVPSIDLGPLTGSASADIGLQAILDATSGTAAINYPVDVQVSTPNTIEPGANLDIITSFAGGQTAQAFLQTQSPNLTAAIDATASADIAAQIQGFGFSVPVDASFGGTNPILELNTSLPTYDLSLGALSLEVNLPQPFTGKGGILNETGVTMPPLQAFGTGDFLTATADLPSLINDILDATGIGAAIPPLSGTIGFGIGSLAYNILTADLTGSLAIGEQTTFTPTALDLTLTPNFGGQAETEPVGSGFVFRVPSGWNQPVVLTPTYSLSGILTTQYGLAGSAALDLSALSLQVVSLGGTLQLGPAFDQTYPLVPSSFLPLLTLPTTTLDLSAGSAVLPGYTIDVQSSSHPTPTWTALTASPETGDIVTGGTILFTLDLSAPATVSGGTPELVLNDGGTATYDAAASVASDLVFNYTVQSGQSTDALSVSTLDLNGASIAGAGGNADLSNVTQSFPNLAVNEPTAVSNSTTLLSDNFTQDSSLNTTLFEINGPAATAALSNFDTSPTATIVTPTITFSPSLGLGLGGASGTYEGGGIQTTKSFSGPFTVTATGLVTSVNAAPLEMAITSANGGRGLAIDGGYDAFYSASGFFFTEPSGPNTHWNFFREATSTPLTLSTPYTLTISVNASDVATASVSAGGNVLGYATADVGPGPFYVVLGEGAGYYSSGSPNQAYWNSLNVSANINNGISLSGEGNTVAYTAGGAAVAIDPNLGVSDATATDLVGASVVISHGFLSGDTLDFTNQNGISGSFDNTTGVLTLSGTASLADYQAALDSVTFSSSAINPTADGTDNSRPIIWSVSGANRSSEPATSTIDIQSASQPVPAKFEEVSGGGVLSLTVS